VGWIQLGTGRSTKIGDKMNVIAKSGPDSVYWRRPRPSINNEQAYLFRSRGLWGTNNVDTRHRILSLHHGWRACEHMGYGA